MTETREPSVVKSLVKKILEAPHEHDWTVQGLGMMRLYLDDERRLHIWDKRLQVENVSAMHTHPWNFRSHVVVGEVENRRFVVIGESKDLDAHDGAYTYKQQTIFCGAGGGLIGESKTVVLDLYSELPEIYTERETYSELAHEIHVSNPKDGTVTIVKREFLEDADHALVFWPYQEEWVSAEPRVATFEEVGMVCESSLEKWFS